MARNKTDANDADGLAHLAEAAFYKVVRVKSYDSMLVRTLVTARTQLMKMQLQLSNRIRGLMKTFGLIVPEETGRVFDGHVCELTASHSGLEQIILPLLARVARTPTQSCWPQQSTCSHGSPERAVPASRFDPRD